ncbi:MAG: hypothetical protein JKY67_22660 [Pseudomonadales bacterium]|nr:hypothetical protein [Pseudomonadales bacterium]
MPLTCQEKLRAQEDVTHWNNHYPPGTAVELMVLGRLVKTRTKGPAEAYYYDSVINVENIPGFVSTGVLVAFERGYAAHREWAKAGEDRRASNVV